MRDGPETGKTPENKPPTEEALRESEARLRIAKNAAHLGTHDWDVTSGTVEWDERTREIWGVGPDEPITYEVFMSGLHPDDRAPTQAAVDRAHDPAGSGEYYAEYRVINRADKAERWVAATGHVFFHEGRAVRLIGTVEDITKRKLMEENLRESREQYRQLVENVNSVIIRMDRSGTILYFNEFAQKFFGYSLDEVLGKNVKLLVPATESTGRDLLEMVDTILQDPDSLVANINENILKNGERVWVSWRNAAIKDAAGNIVGNLTVGQDITGLKQAEDRYRSLFNGMTEGFAVHEIICDERGEPSDYRFLEVNPAFERLTGLKRNNLLGRTVKEVMPGTEAYWIETYGRVALTGEPARFENFASALQKHYEVFAYSPAPRQFAVMFTDITMRKRAEAALRESEQRWATTLASIGDAVIATDVAGRITFMNPVAEGLTGWTLRDALQRPITEIFTIVNEQNRTAVESPVTKVLHEGMVVGLANHTILVRRDGTEVPIDDSGAPIRDNDGTTMGVVLVFRDITERKQAEEALRESERTQRLLAQIGEIATRSPRSGEMVEAIGECVSRELGVSRCGFSRVDLGAGQVTVLQDYHSHLSSLAGVYPMTGYADYVEDGLAGRPVAFEDTATDPRTAQGYATNFATIQVRAHLTVPLLRGGEWVANFWVSHHEPRLWTAADMKAMKLIADRVWLAIERQRAEEELRRSEERFRTAVQNPNITLSQFDRDLRYTWIHNPHPDFTPSQLLGKRGVDVEDSEGMRRFNDLKRQVVETGKRVRDEVTFNRSDGATTCDVIIEPLFGDGGNLIGGTTSALDITERKRAENRLATDLAALTRMHALSTKALEAGGLEPMLQEIMDAAVAVVEADKGTLQLVENDCLRIVAHHGHERPFLDFFAAAENVASVCGEATRRGERVVVEDVEASPLFIGTPSLPILRNAGVRAVQSTPLRSRKGELLGILTTQCGSPYVPDEHDLWRIDLLARQAADMIEQVQAGEALKKAHDELEIRIQERTAELRQAYDRLKEETEEREQIEAQLRQAQKMEALGTMSGGIAHDFNNILAAIIGFTELLEGHASKESRDARHLHRIMEAGVRGRELVRQMLTFARKAEQEKKPLALSSIVKETVKLIRATTPSTIGIRVNAASEALILGDPTQIQQVLMNLCTNAAYAMQEKGGNLDIELSDHTVLPSNGNPDGVAPGLYVKLIVRDTGTGIPADIVDKIFDPFFTTKKVGEGTGLGLSVVHGIMMQHDGSITVISEPGKGSTFTVYFPRIAGDVEADALHGDEIPTGSERILFVDDEEALVEMGEDILAELGYEVTSRMNGREALALLKSDPARFDLVITDQTMPEMTGIEFAKETFAIRADIPIIMCTGFSYAVDADKAKAAGIKAFAMKPLTKREIATTIRKVLDE